ncbi:MAG TPA: AAA family ATPase [Bacteroidales bacterium]|nr:AAA family ATPase [Bacteroidales bacterium]
MKIRSIKLKNIHSFKGEVTIDFENGPLAQTGLFAIIGPTGSGKSTLLDAITLALYNATPRAGILSKASIEKTGAIITRHTDDAFSEVEYEAGGEIYRARWEISRARTGNLREYELSLAMKDAEGVFRNLDLKRKDVADRNAAIIGLTYDQFMKSILLSQGEFARFLKAAPKERSALLEKITGTGIYRRIGAAAFEQQKQQKLLCDQFQQQLGSIVMMDEETRLQTEGQLKILQKEAIVHRNLSGKIQQQIERKKQLLLRRTTLQEVREQIEKLTQKKLELQDDAGRLKLHQALLPLKSDIDRLLSLRQKLVGDREEESLTKLRLQKLRDEIKSSKDQYTVAKQQSENLNLEVQKMQPVFDEVLLLDKQLDTHRTSLQHILKQILEIDKETGQAQEQQKTLGSTLQEIDEKLAGISRFLEQNPVLEKLPDALPEITNEIKHATTAGELLIKQINEALLGHQHTAITSGDEREKLLSSQHEKLATHRQQLIDGMGGKIITTKEILEQISRLEKLLSGIIKLLQLLEEKETLRKAEMKTTEELAQMNEQVTLVMKSCDTSGKAIEIAESRLAELEATKTRQALEANYEQARQLLQPGQPCPLCGATAHPFAEEHPAHISEFDIFIKKQKEEKSALVENLKVQQKQLNLAFSEVKTRENIQLMQQKRKKELAAEIEKAEDLLPDEVAPKDASALQSQQQKAEKDLAAAKINLEIVQEFIALEQNIKTVAELKDKNKAWLLQEQNLARLLAPFAVYLSECGNDYAKISKTLENQLRYYREAIRLQQEKKEEKTAVDTKIENIIKRLEALADAKKNLTEERLVQQTKFTELNEQRVGIFGEKDVATAQRELTQKQRAAESQAATLATQLARSETAETNESRQLAKLGEEIGKQTKESEALAATLQPQLAEAKMETVQQAADALLPAAEARRIDEMLTAHDKAMSQAAFQRKTLEKEIEDLQKDDDATLTVEMLADKKAAADEALDQNNQRTGDLRRRLEEHDENAKRHSVIVQQLKAQQKEYQRWDALNRVMGDAQGMRFSRFAQRLTLLHLLGRANQHLKKLSARYILINEGDENDDELFVIDTQHGDDRRSVNTLSGGESFMVSLALALGLSDLAGKNTRINSLFIDEGFGSLDQETLDTALSTLERLQHETNRTIGIISHVAALKERITTQIELTKDAGGRSSITVRG